LSNNSCVNKKERGKNKTFHYIISKLIFFKYKINSF